MKILQVHNFSHIREGASGEADALVSGTPVIMILIGELGELVEHRYGWQLLSQSRASGLAKSPRIIVDVHNKARNLAVTALATACEWFSLEQHFEQLLAISAEVEIP